MYKEAIEVQRKEIKKQRNYFYLEIKIPEDENKELEEKRSRHKQKQKRKKKSFMSKSQILKEEKRITQS